MGVLYFFLMGFELLLYLPEMLLSVVEPVIGFSEFVFVVFEEFVLAHGYHDFNVSHVIL